MAGLVPIVSKWLWDGHKSLYPATKTKRKEKLIYRASDGDTMSGTVLFGKDSLCLVPCVLC